MSVGSVRTANKVAAADGKVTLAEAETSSFIAGRTSGVDDGEKKEINQFIAEKLDFEPGSREHLAAVAAPEPTAATPLPDAVKQIVNAKGLDVFSQLKDADENKFSPALKAKLGDFAKILGNVDGDSLAESVGTFVAGGRAVYVAVDCDGENRREVVAFFDEKGNDVGRAAIDDDKMTMAWLKADGKPGTPIGTPTEHGVDKLPKNFQKELEAWVEKKQETGNDFGKEIEDPNQLPPVIRRRFEMMQRTIADGKGAYKATLKVDGESVPVYVLGDFSCVSTYYFLTENGTELYSFES